MATEVLSVTSEDSYWQHIRKAAQALREGRLIAFPTETVYGVAGSAEDAHAIQRLREVKGRDRDRPLTVHLGRKDQAEHFVNDLTAVGRHLVQRSWPGPLTIVVDVPEPQKTPVSEGKDAGFTGRVYHDNSVGLRCPDCPAARDVINEARCIVLASSANGAGKQPPTTAEGVIEQLDGDIAIVLDGGKTQYAKPSTIVRISGNGAELLREGVLDERAVRGLATKHILLVCTGNTCRSPMAAGLLRAMLAENLGCAIQDLPANGYNVTSAGTMAMAGAPATPQAVEALADNNIDISDHRSSLLTADIVNGAQMILTMTGTHRDAVIGLVGNAEQRSLRLCEDRDISDPIGGSLELYKACRDQITAGLQTRFAEIIR